MPVRPCSVAGCPRFATAKGLCDHHRREYERSRSRERQHVRKPNDELIERRDRAGYVPTKHRR